MLNSKDHDNHGADVIDIALKNYLEAAKGVQAIATEAAGYSKKSIDDAVSHVGTLSGAKSFEAALELQSNFAKSYYENFVAEATKIGEMYTEFALSLYKPDKPRADGGVRDSVSEAA
ncbi:phasin family protein [Rhizobium sp. HT1-10]|uniref:phasin family protein n=1 Tax=Rhizobium sp. HT1-10 TaxID=3111638 RepID=UPI003C24260B